MITKRTQTNPNPADLLKHYTDMINVERANIEQSLRNIAHYGEQLTNIAVDTNQRLLTRD